MDLPCRSRHWQAETEQAWAALHPWTEAWPPSQSFTACIGTVMQTPAVARSTHEDDYVRFLILTALGRMIWDYKEATSHQGARYLLTYDVLMKGQEQLLGIMDTFVSPTYSYPFFVGQHHHDETTIQMLKLAAASRGLAKAALVCDMMGMLWQDGVAAGPARQQILEWTKENPKDARTLMFTCAQLLDLTRRYPSNHPQEPYDAFHGGVGIWILSTIETADYLVQATSSDFSSPLPVCNLDWHGAPDAPEAMVVRDWIEYGVPCVVRMHGITDVYTTNGARQALDQTADVLANMSAWGIKDTLYNAIKRIIQSQP